MTSSSIVIQVLTLFVFNIFGQEKDPCEPNPCGDNTRCQSVLIRKSPVISCECLIGFKVPVGGNSADGCIEDETSDSQYEIPVGGTPSRGPSQSPRALDSGNDNDDERRLGAGVRPVQLIPRVSVTRDKPETDNTRVDVDTPELFPDECLIHEDCEQDKYCSPAPELKCVGACTLAVCGDHALCTAALHRPVCACEDGYEGNPYDKCTKMPSRVGMRFRKK